MSGSAAKDRRRKKAPPHRAAAQKTAAAPAPAQVTPASGWGDRVSWWALLAMVFVVPLATSNFTILGFEHSFTDDVFEIVKVSVLRILTCVAVGAWAWNLLRKGGRIRHTPLDWLILAFVIWVAISTATSVHWPTALLGKPSRYEGLLTFVNYAVLYFLVLQLADRSSRVRSLARSLFWSSVVVAVFGLLQYLGVQHPGWVPLGFEPNRAFSTYGNPNFLGGFLIFSVTVALGLALLERRRVWRLLYWAGFGLNGLALIATFTRGAWIGGFVSLVLLSVIAWRQRPAMQRIDWIPAGASLAVGLGIIIRSLSSSSEVLNFARRIGSIFQFSSGSGQSRMEIWRSAFAAIADRPILGSGPDTFRLVFHRFKTAEYVRIKGGSSGADNAHNYLLHLASGVGFPGLLLFAAVFVWAAVRSFTTIFKRSDDPFRLMLGAFWAASAGYLIHLFFGLSLPGTSFLVWTALAIVLVPTARSIGVKVARWGTVAGVAVIVIVAAGVAYQGVVLAADHSYSKSQTASLAGEQTQEALRATELNPLNADYRQGLGLAYLAEMRAYLQAGAEAQQKGEDTTPYEKQVVRSFLEAKSALEKAIDFTPPEYDNYVILASLYNLAGEAMDADLYQDAIQVAERGLQIMPLGTSIRVQLAHSLVATGRIPEAVDALEYCVQIDPTGGEAAAYLAGIYQQQGDPDKALELLRSVEALAPGQPGIAEAIRELEAGAGAPIQSR